MELLEQSCDVTLSSETSGVYLVSNFRDNPHMEQSLLETELCEWTGSGLEGVPVLVQNHQTGFMSFSL